MGLAELAQDTGEPEAFQLDKLGSPKLRLSALLGEEDSYPRRGDRGGLQVNSPHLREAVAKAYSGLRAILATLRWNWGMLACGLRSQIVRLALDIAAPQFLHL